MSAKSRYAVHAAAKFQRALDRVAELEPKLAAARQTLFGAEEILLRAIMEAAAEGKYVPPDRAVTYAGRAYVISDSPGDYPAGSRVTVVGVVS